MRPRRLRSAETRTLLVSQTLTNFGDRTFSAASTSEMTYFVSGGALNSTHALTHFSAAGPRVWNYLSTDLRQPALLYSRFRQSLKTFLFVQWGQSAV